MYVFYLREETSRRTDMYYTFHLKKPSNSCELSTSYTKLIVPIELPISERVLLTNLLTTCHDQNLSFQFI